MDNPYQGQIMYVYWSLSYFITKLGCKWFVGMYRIEKNLYVFKNSFDAPSGTYPRDILHNIDFLDPNLSYPKPHQ